MGKVSVRRCDSCDQLDCDANRVLRCTVIGIRRDMCHACRVDLMNAFLDDMAVAEAKATEMELSRDAGRGSVTLSMPDDDDDELPDDMIEQATETAAAAD